jgi:hypothetical protein
MTSKLKCTSTVSDDQEQLHFTHLPRYTSPRDHVGTVRPRRVLVSEVVTMFPIWRGSYNHPTIPTIAISQLKHIGNKDEVIADINQCALRMAAS